jgi:hypothetical protein
MNSDLENRIKRIYSALNVMVENDIAKTVTVTETPGKIRFSFDGGMSEADLQNAVMTLIGLIAHLPEHLKHWLRENNKPVQEVVDLVNRCDEFKIIADLWDADKHGGARRDGGISKRSPRIKSLQRSLQPQPGSQFMRVMFSYGPDGSGVRSIDGEPQVVIDGVVVDGNESKIGDLAKILESGFSVFESRFQELGITSSDTQADA